MAIPEGRISTIPVIGKLQEPEDIQRFPLVCYERGPKAIEDTSEGLLYQNWVSTWDPNSGIVTLTPYIFGGPVELPPLQDLVMFNFTFSQTGKVNFAYTTSVSSFLQWYDTSIGQIVTTDLGSAAKSPQIHLDDKRVTQDQSNDMLLWYLKAEAGDTHALYMRVQRERFQIEYLMASSIKGSTIQKVGMSDGLRIELHLRK